MTKIQHKRSDVLISGAAKAPTSVQLDYGEIAVNYNASDPQLFFKNSSGSVVSFFEPYAPLSGAAFTGDVSFASDVDLSGAVTIHGDATNGSGKLSLTCESDTHTVHLKAPAHSAAANYTLTLPTSEGTNTQVLTSDGSGNLYWAVSSMSTADKAKLDGIESGATADQTGAEIKALYEAESNTNAFTDAEKTKLSGIASGAEVNVKADWNATSGDAQILNKPTIPTNNNQLTNGAGYISSFDITTQTDPKYLRSNSPDTIGSSLTLSSTASIKLPNSSGYGIYSSTGNRVLDCLDGTVRIGSTAQHTLIRLHGQGSDDFRVFYGGNDHLIWHAGNDGSGSGLDADTVDGIQASSFLRSDASDTATGQITLQRNSASATDFSLWIKNNATSSRAQIRFSNNITDQNGYFYYRHEDGSSNSAANSFHFDSDQVGVAVIIDDTGANSGYYVGTNKVWHQGNDGSGSGLDADNLDGYSWTSSGKNLRGTNIYADDWFRNYNSGEGIYNEANNTHFYSDATNTWRVRSNQTTVSLRMATASNTTRGYFYASHNNEIGILDSDGNWAIKHVRDSRTEFYVNNTEYGELNSDYLYHSSDIRSKIFYDSDNTSYYIHPASTSQLVGLNIRSFIDLADADVIRMGSSDDWTIAFNSNGWNYINQKASGIIFQDNGTNVMRLEDSGIFRPETSNTGTIGTSSYYWDNGYFQDFNVSGTINVRGALDLADNDILRLGSSDDAELFCNGSHLYLDLNSGIGNFYIRDGTTTRFTFDDNGNFTATGGATLDWVYHADQVRIRAGGLSNNDGTDDGLIVNDDGWVVIMKDTLNWAEGGAQFENKGRRAIFTTDSDSHMMRRNSTSGPLLDFYSSGTFSGRINLGSATVVQYLGGHLARLSQWEEEIDRFEIYRGTVLSNVDIMCEWEFDETPDLYWAEGEDIPEDKKVGDLKQAAVTAGVEDNEQLNRVKISDVVGDRNIAGVFEHYEDENKSDPYGVKYNKYDDFSIAQTGDYIIRIGKDTVVEMGDLLMSAGDGTAMPQQDDIIRSCTIAKVTCTSVREVYPDGSYTVPCLLMAC